MSLFDRFKAALRGDPPPPRRTLTDVIARIRDEMNGERSEWFEQELAATALLATKDGDTVHCIVVAIDDGPSVRGVEFSACNEPEGSHGFPPPPSVSPGLSFMILTGGNVRYIRDQGDKVVNVGEA